ncbi:hypothetical protein Hanom_Chr00s127195g01813961 [Helianthus anomalus]
MNFLHLVIRFKLDLYLLCGLQSVLITLCKACILDVHRSCDYCSFVLCLVCYHDMHDGYLHSKIENLKETKMIRTKRSKKSWRFLSDGRIGCPPKHIGGCENGLLRLMSFYRLYLTKDLEESAQRLIRRIHLKKLFGLSDHLFRHREHGEGLVRPFSFLRLIRQSKRCSFSSRSFMRYNWKKNVKRKRHLLGGQRIRPSDKNLQGVIFERLVLIIFVSFKFSIFECKYPLCISG